MRAFRLLVLFCAATPLLASAAAPPKNLSELLSRVRQGYREDSAELKQREAEFRKDRNQQAHLLREAEKELAKLQSEGKQLEAAFQDNEAEVSKLEAAVQRTAGDLGELYGVVHEAVGDLQAELRGSVSSAEYPKRNESLKGMSEDEGLPSLDELERLWFAYQHEIIASGQVSRFQAEVVSTDGQSASQEVIRVGAFNAVSQGRYLNWIPETERLETLPRQPSDPWPETAGHLERASNSPVLMGIDPSRGQLLAHLIHRPNPMERVAQGGAIGSVIIGLGILAGLLALYRFIAISFVSLAVRRQEGRSEPSPKNPLGRILQVYETDKSQPTDVLELRLDEAIIRETAGLNRMLWAIKLVAVASPLLGLLGTVTGMIQTFQAITLFGAGDPKLMAGGISEALVTTMLGLTVAIPLVLVHAALANQANRLSDRLEEGSAGLIARQAEAKLKAEEVASGAAV